MLCNCLYCKNIANTLISLRICKECDKILYKKIRDYLDEYPNSNMRELSKGCDISYEIIEEYILSGTININESKLNKCSKCGDVISKDEIYCPKCELNMKLEKLYTLTYDKKDKSINNGYHISGRGRR